MYLKQLYRHNKWWFAVIVLFITAQLLNNIRQDIAVSPIYAYGMYSAHIPPVDQYGVFEITVNGKKLTPEGYNMHAWDKIILPLQYYADSKRNNNGMYNADIKRLLHVFGVGADTANFEYAVNVQAFMHWYAAYLATIIHKKVYAVSVDWCVYQRAPYFSKIKTQPYAQLCR